MYVKVCKANGVEIIHECDTVTFNPHGIPEAPGHSKMCMLIDKKGGDRIIVDIDDSITGVYSMSDAGKTIDAKHF
jgi:hypothetical protein